MSIAAHMHMYIAGLPSQMRTGGCGVFTVCTSCPHATFAIIKTGAAYTSIHQLSCTGGPAGAVASKRARNLLQSLPEDLITEVCL